MFSTKKPHPPGKLAGASMIFVFFMLPCDVIVGFGMDAKGRNGRDAGNDGARCVKEGRIPEVGDRFEEGLRGESAVMVRVAAAATQGTNLGLMISFMYGARL